jgi:hypothetical protein
MQLEGFARPHRHWVVQSGRCRRRGSRHVWLWWLARAHRVHYVVVMVVHVFQRTRSRPMIIEQHPRLVLIQILFLVEGVPSCVESLLCSCRRG